MTRVNHAKIDLIKEISDLLREYNRPPLTEKDFDLLYDMDIDHLMETRTEIYQRLKDLKELVRG